MQLAFTAPLRKSMKYSKRAWFYIAVQLLAGMAALVNSGIAGWRSDAPARSIFYLATAAAASGMKVRLPGLSGTMSVYFLVVLIGISDLTRPETILMACVCTLIQSFWRAQRRPLPVQIGFNLANALISVSISWWLYHLAAWRALGLQKSTLLLAGVSVVFFALNTVPVALVISLTERKAFREVWRDSYAWSFPYYLVGAAIAEGFSTFARAFGWQSAILLGPLIYLIQRTYLVYIGRLENQKAHAESIASLHLRTIEALALAIDAKDQTTHDHLQRVQIYATAIGEELGISDLELEALRAASLLHDIGKLAIPEYIVSKPGKLTPEEFEKMKTHPVVGAEILEHVEFPYPVVPIVQAHHEKWDGTGYPAGLKGDSIPIGARILAVVDCLDALASDRQYRRALPLDEAMAVVASEAGKAFDPAVVAVLSRRYRILEAEVAARVRQRKPLRTDLPISKGEAPAAGFETSDNIAVGPSQIFSVAAARQEAQTLHGLSELLGEALTLEDMLSMLAGRIQRLIPYDALAVYLLRDSVLLPTYVHGDHARQFNTLEIPCGQGLSGWVAENGKPILNGNPAVETGYLNDPTKFTVLSSAVSVPLTASSTTIGVLSLYRAEKDAFAREHLRSLEVMASKLAPCLARAPHRSRMLPATARDILTGLPGITELFAHLETEISQAKCEGWSLAVIACDLDGFRTVNEHHGSLAGDRVLASVAARFVQCGGERSFVARLGGDEFVVVLAPVSPYACNEKIRDLEASYREAGVFICGETDLGLTAAAALYPDDGTTADGLLEAADRRLLAAKPAKDKMLGAALFKLEEAVSASDSINYSFDRPTGRAACEDV
jgi:diguanylate cyclase (GGDEF)-like protein/putative nucleotidyltransferase with HDIG domain